MDFFIGDNEKVYSPRYPLNELKCERCGEIIVRTERQVISINEYDEVLKMLYLEGVFKDFCEYLSGKLRWTESKDKEWTNIVLKFFNEKNKAETIPYTEEFDYMRVDYVWRYNRDRYSIFDIVLAVEHEGQERNIDTLIEEEIQHLIDLKAENKVGIFYPRMGDEKEFIEKIRNRIAFQSSYFRISHEKYLVVLGYATTKMGKRAILFKGFVFDQNGNLQKQMEQTILQKVSSPHD